MKMFVITIETIYKSGRKRQEAIVTDSEEGAWNYHKKHHNYKKILSSEIVDAYEF